jgi:hypothetical protein
MLALSAPAPALRTVSNMTNHTTPHVSDSIPAQQPKVVVCTHDNLFGLGQPLITHAALADLGWSAVDILLARHIIGDWGDLCTEDKEANWTAIDQRFRIFSRYNTKVGDFYVITEWDRSYTTVLRVSEY